MLLACQCVRVLVRVASRGGAWRMPWMLPGCVQQQVFVCWVYLWV